MYTIVYETYLEYERQKQYEEIVDESFLDIKNSIKLGWSFLKKKVYELINRFRVWIVQFFSKKVYLNTEGANLLSEEFRDLTDMISNSYCKSIEEGDLVEVIKLGERIKSSCSVLKSNVFFIVDSNKNSSPIKFKNVYSLYDKDYFKDINGILDSIKNTVDVLTLDLFDAADGLPEEQYNIIRNVTTGIMSVITSVTDTFTQCVNKLSYKGKDNMMIE